MTKTFTDAELREFDRLTMGLSSRDQMTRIRARLDLKEYVAEHGKDKCDAIFTELAKREVRKASRKW